MVKKSSILRDKYGQREIDVVKERQMWSKSDRYGQRELYSER